MSCIGVGRMWVEHVAGLVVTSQLLCIIDRHPYTETMRMHTLFTLLGAVLVGCPGRHHTDPSPPRTELSVCSAAECERLGIQYMSSAQPDFERAHRLLTKACGFGRQGACFYLAILLDDGKGTQRNRAHASELWLDACRSGFVESCLNVLVLWEKVPSLEQAAFHAPVMNVLSGACSALDNPQEADLTWAQTTGPEKIRSILVRSCGSVGSAALEGRGVARNLEQGQRLLSMACARGHIESCYNLGLVLGKGDPLPQDLARAETLLSKACNAKVPSACTSLGNVYGLQGNYAGAVNMQTLTCDQGDPVGCFNLGGLYEAGQGVPRHLPTARRYYEKACDAGNTPACDVLKRLE